MTLTPYLYLMLLPAVLRLWAAFARGLANRPSEDLRDGHHVVVLTPRGRQTARTDAINVVGNAVPVVVLVLLILGACLR